MCFAKPPVSLVFLIIFPKQYLTSSTFKSFRTHNAIPFLWSYNNSNTIIICAFFYVVFLFIKNIFSFHSFLVLFLCVINKCKGQQKRANAIKHSPFVFLLLVKIIYLLRVSPIFETSKANCFVIPST